MELFLTSSVHAVAGDIANRVDLEKGKKLVFIDTAAEPEAGDKQWLADDRRALVGAGFEVEDYTITGKTEAMLKNDLDKFDFIYLSGGDTVYLLEKSHESGFTQVIADLIEQGKVYIGTSAGSMAAGPKCMDYLVEEADLENIEKIEGYKLVNFVVMPHWGSEHFRDLYLGGRLEKVYKYDQIPLILLTDNQYVWMRDGKMEIVDATGLD